MKQLLSLKSKRERGQAIVLVAIALVGIISMVGLMIDVGTLFIESSRMKRAIDAAAVAASLKFRTGVDLTEKTNTPVLYEAAKEFILMNEGEAYDIETYICDPAEVPNPDYEHADLCSGTVDTSDDKKLVKVIGVKDVQFNFLPIIGIDSTRITAQSIGEAASVDVVLVIDSSQSMVNETPPEDGGKDFTVCNPAHACQPFEKIKGYAKDFAEKLLYPYDRVSVVSFDRLAHNATTTANGWESNANQIKNTIDSLMIYRNDLPLCSDVRPGAGICAEYPGGVFTTACPHWEDTGGFNGGDAASCTSSNIGGGLELANFQFTRDMREEALWIIILLASGPANAISPTETHPIGYCPPGTSDPRPLPEFYPAQQPLCRDDQADERHCGNEDTRGICEAAGGTWDLVNYDGDDFARDIADGIVADGQGAVIYTIGYGDLINFDIRHRTEPYDPDIAAQLLRYIATEAGTPNMGIYLPAPTDEEVAEAFTKIAENIATKISQ